MVAGSHPLLTRWCRRADELSELQLVRRTVICGITIGKQAFFAAGAMINRDVEPFALMADVPARHIVWMSRFGERVPLPFTGSVEHRCPHAGSVYGLHGDTLTIHA